MLKRFSQYIGRRYLQRSVFKAEEQSQLEKCLCLEDRCIVQPQCGMPKVVVVGGGFSGLSAAHRLISCGLTDVTILEACERVGGRVLSAWLGDTLVELGIGSIGPRNIVNPAYNLAMMMDDSENLQDLKHSPYVFVTSDGKAITDFATEKRLFKNILSETETLSKGKTSLLQFLELRIQQELLYYPENLRPDAEKVLYGLANRLRVRYGADISTLSAPLITAQKSMHGGEVYFPHGNSSIIQYLIKHIPYQQIKLRKEVTKINWQPKPSTKPRACVETEDGELYEADYVIIALPSGVLRESAAEMFSPPLPESKMDALNSVGIGCIDKIFAEYEQPFWAGKHFRMGFAWSPAELVQPGNWMKGISEIRAVSKSVLSFEISGEEALVVEDCSEEEIAMELTRLIRKLMRDTTIPFPHHIIVTRWGTSKYCKGSVINIQLNTSIEHLEELGVPIPAQIGDATPVLLFAGDMTVPAYFSEFPAARIAGLREAERVLQLTKSFGGPPKPLPEPPCHKTCK